VLAPLAYTAIPSGLEIPPLSIGQPMEPIEVGAGRSGGRAPFTWSVVGLPPGLSIEGHGVGNGLARIVGTPTATRPLGNFTIRVTDSS
jgi:hypothetical protein